jgi:hypothetical protein
MDEDSTIHDELERLAWAHLIAENAGATNLGEDGAMEVNPVIAATLQYALQSSLRGSSQDMAAIVSVSAATPLPADWLFRLEAPVSTPEQLETMLGLESGKLPTVNALREEGEDRGDEHVQFVFVTDDIKRRIEQQVRGGIIKLLPLFVKVTKAGAAM